MSDNETVFKQLIQKSQNGDRNAYTQLLQGLSLFLNNYLKKRVFNKSEIEEVTQEILMAVHKSLHTYNSDKAFMSWFLSITEYKVIDYIRQLKNNMIDIESSSVSEFASMLSTDSDLKIDLEKALNQLSTREKQVFTLLKVNGLSISEVALDLKISEANVKVIAHRAYLNLKIFLGSQI